MPVAFDKCVKRGGKVRTIKPSKGTYQHTCTIDGKTHKGYVKKTKGKPRKKK